MEFVKKAIMPKNGERRRAMPQGMPTQEHRRAYITHAHTTLDTPRYIKYIDAMKSSRTATHNECHRVSTHKRSTLILQQPSFAPAAHFQKAPRLAQAATSRQAVGCCRRQSRAPLPQGATGRLRRRRRRRAGAAGCSRRRHGRSRRHQSAIYGSCTARATPTAAAASAVAAVARCWRRAW